MYALTFLISIQLILFTVSAVRLKEQLIVSKRLEKFIYLLSWNLEYSYSFLPCAIHLLREVSSVIKGLKFSISL